MFENIRKAIQQKVAQGEAYRKRSAARQAMKQRPSDRRVIEAGNWTDPQGRNIPDPWRTREYSKTRQTGNLPSVIGDITGTSGPRRSMYPQILNPQLFNEARRPRPFRGESEYQAQITELNEQSSGIAMDMKSRGIASSRPRRQHLSRDERLARAGPSEVHSVALDSIRKHPGRGTDVLPDTPYPRPMPLSGQNLNQFPILRSIAKRMGVM